MSDTVTVQHPDRDDSTITVTAKAYAAVYAGEGYVLAGGSKVPATTALEQENARLREQLAGREATAPLSRDDVLAQPARAPRKRAPRKATATTAVAPAPGPADIGSAGTLDTI